MGEVQILLVIAVLLPYAMLIREHGHVFVLQVKVRNLDVATAREHTLPLDEQ